MKIKNYVSEGVGTFLLLFIGCGGMVFLNDPVSIGLSFGLVYFVLFYSFGNLSGCHFNPIISISYLINKKINFTEFCCYLLSQVLGGLFGTLLLRIILPNNFPSFHTYVTDLCCNGDVIAAIFVEIIASYLLVLSFIGANSKSRNKNIRGLIIGATVTIIGMVTSILNYSMCNPIKAFMSSLFNNNWSLTLVFIIVPFIGSIIATYHWKWLANNKDEQNE